MNQKAQAFVQDAHSYRVISDLENTKGRPNAAQNTKAPDSIVFARFGDLCTFLLLLEENLENPARDTKLFPQSSKTMEEALHVPRHSAAFRGAECARRNTCF